MPEARVPYRAHPWQKPRVDGYVVARFREILRIPDEDDLPEALWLMLGLHSAINGHFAEGNMSHDQYVFMVLEAESFYRARGKPRYSPGTEVFIKPLNQNGIYVHVGIMGRHLVNMNGRFFLFSLDELEDPHEEVPLAEPVQGNKRTKTQQLAHA